MTIFTIGFTRKSAEQFFTMLKKAGATRLADVRLNNVSQLAGFSKKEDLRYFTREICGIDYVHLPILAPTDDILYTAKKEKNVDWTRWERAFLSLMAERRIEDNVPREVLDGACLLCSEEKPDHCHRRLVAEYLNERWGGVRIQHLL
jgi:uncharacterized protein (DUF488 family)